MVYIPDPYFEVVLTACEPGDPIVLNHVPLWFDEKRVSGEITPVAGDLVDGSDWVYLSVATFEGLEMCKTDEIVGQYPDGSLYTREQGKPPHKPLIPGGYLANWEEKIDERQISTEAKAD